MELNTAGDAAEFVEALRRAGRTVVLTTGCFDIPHAGHLGLLEDARALGDALIVGINADERIGRLKGAGHPVMCEEYRARMLSALRCVDYVFVFPEDLPSEAIRTVKPDIFVKGRCYLTREMPEVVAVEEVGGRVEIVVSEAAGAELHTSDIIAHIKQRL